MSDPTCPAHTLEVQLRLSNIEEQNRNMFKMLEEVRDMTKTIQALDKRLGETIILVEQHKVTLPNIKTDIDNLGGKLTAIDTRVSTFMGALSMGWKVAALFLGFLQVITLAFAGFIFMSIIQMRDKYGLYDQRISTIERRIDPSR